MNIKCPAFIFKEGPRECLPTRMLLLSVGLRPTASTSPGSVLKLLIRGFYLRSVELNTPGVVLSCLCFNKPSRGFWWVLKCEKAVQENSCFLDVWLFLTTLKSNRTVCLSILFLSSLTIHRDSLWIKGEGRRTITVFAYSDAKRSVYCLLSWQGNDAQMLGLAHLLIMDVCGNWRESGALKWLQ